MSITASIRGSIYLTDNLTGSTSLSKVLNNSYTGDLSTYGQTVTVGTSVYNAGLPVSPVQFVYVKNLSSTSGTTLTVTWTPTGGVSASVVILDPGAFIMFAEVNTTNGISALSMVSNQVGTPVEYILVG
jgi:hypothetical protein